MMKNKIKFVLLFLCIVVVFKYKFLLCIINVLLLREFHVPLYDWDEPNIFYGKNVYELAWEVNRDNVEKINEILSKDSSIINDVDYAFGITVLRQAIRNGNYKSACELVKYGADPTLGYKYMDDTYSTMLYAIYCKKYEYVDVFLNAKNMSRTENLVVCLEECIKRDTCLRHVRQFCDLGVVDYDKEGTLLSQAVRSGKYDIAVLLLENNALYVEDYEFINKYSCPKKLSEYMNDSLLNDTAQLRYRDKFVRLLKRN